MSLPEQSVDMHGAPHEQGRGDQLMIAPPFVITEEQIDECLDILRGVLTGAYDKWRAA